MTVERMFFSGGDDCRENVFQEVMTVERRKKNSSGEGDDHRENVFFQEEVMAVERMLFFRRR